MNYYIIDNGRIEKVDEKPKPSLGAKDIISDYYGMPVVNYVCSDSNINEALVNDNINWLIFYSDNENIYLISSDYIPLSCLPHAKGDETKAKPENTDNKYPKAAPFDNIIGLYDGSVNITDERLKSLNSKYYKYLEENNKTSSTTTMKAIAYMMDIYAWSGFCNEKADYTIGGATLELLFASYNKKYYDGTEKYQTRAENASGYKISKDNGTNWSSYYTGMLNTNDKTYNISSYNSAYGAWLLSPSASGGDMFRTQYFGKVCDGATTGNCYGFRPIICLKNSTRLIDNENNTFSLVLN